jgi:HD-like signal output (HDOD) protein
MDTHGTDLPRADAAGSPVLRILFVDDDPNLLAALHQKLHSLKGEWAMTFARSAGEALALLRQSQQDVVVSDRHIPGFDQAADRSEPSPPWPSTVRIVLSGQSDEESSLRTIGSAGQEGVCDAAHLRSVVQRAVALQRLVQNERVRVVVARMDTLPSAPALLHELTAELAKEECSLVHAGEIISQDVAMTAKILRLVNSAYFGFRCKISDPILAVRFLGIKTVSSLVMACHIFQHADPKLAIWLGLDRIWSHSLMTSQWARRIAEAETKDSNLIDDSLAAGMLHDAGRLVLAVNFPNTYREMIENTRSTGENLLEQERSLLGVTHAEVGAYLMGTWGLRDTIVEAIAYHHTPGECVHRGFAPLTAVHAACAMQRVRVAFDAANIREAVDHDYLKATGLSSRIDHWRTLWDETPVEETLTLD